MRANHAATAGAAARSAATDGSMRPNQSAWKQAASATVNVSSITKACAVRRTFNASRYARSWSRACGAWAVSASMFSPGTIFSRSALNSSGSVGPIDARTAVAAAVKSWRSAHHASGSIAPAVAAGNTAGSGCRRSISRRMQAVSQYTSAPICSTGMRR